MGGWQNLWNRLHYVENEIQIMHHVLKMWLISSLPKYIKWISRVVFIHVFAGRSNVKSRSFSTRLVHSFTISWCGCRQTTTVLQTASNKRNSWMRCAWVNCLKSLRLLCSGTCRKSSWCSSSCRCVFTRRGTGAPGRSFKFCTKTLVTVNLSLANPTKQVPELSHWHSKKILHSL